MHAASFESKIKQISRNVQFVEDNTDAETT